MSGTMIGFVNIAYRARRRVLEIWKPMRACAMHCPRFSLFRFLSFRAYLSSFLDTYHILLFSHDISSLRRRLYLIRLPHEFTEVKRYRRRVAPCVVYFNKGS